VVDSVLRSNDEMLTSRANPGWWNTDDEITHIQESIEMNDFWQERKNIERDYPIAHETMPRVPARYAQKEAAIATAVWNGEIDQMSTDEVAQQFEIQHVQALHILKKIAKGKCGYRQFEYDPARQGVKISDGSIFTYSPVDVDGKGMSDKRPKHYIWFCS
jgi:hypothetical protein